MPRFGALGKDAGIATGPKPLQIRSDSMPQHPSSCPDRPGPIPESPLEPPGPYPILSGPGPSISWPPAFGQSSGDRHFYDVPGSVDDLSSLPRLREDWSRVVDGVLDQIIKNKEDKRLRHNFFNLNKERETPIDGSFVKWQAYPKNCNKYGGKKWIEADTRSNQDEYCEWEVETQTVNGVEHLKRVTFTTELPEYHNFLRTADKNGSRLLSVYNKILDDKDVKSDHIYIEQDKKYDKVNCWNTRTKGTSIDGQDTKGCIVHMIRDNNTLFEAADLVADSTILWYDDDDEIITDGQAILRDKLKVSAESPGRNSDPTIVEKVNSCVREGKRVTVLNPVGMYIDEFQSQHITTETGGSVSHLWAWERGTKDHYVRGTFTVPENLLGKLKEKNGGRKIRYGSQIAQHVWIAVHIAIADSTAPPPATEPGPVWSFIEGRHIKPVRLPPGFVKAELCKDPFGKYLATTEKPAITLKDLLSTLDNYTWVAFAADEGIGFKFNKERKNVRVRLVIICTPDHQAQPNRRSRSKMADPKVMVERAFQKPTMAIVAVAPSDNPNNIHSERSILQVASFNQELGWFNFYDRERFDDLRWLYFGSSKDAFTPDTQGLGPFCGHPNGGLVMKENEDPWPHWHTAESELRLPNDHPMKKDPLFFDQDSSGPYFAVADHLSTIVEAGTREWFNTRRVLDFGSSSNPNPTAVRIYQWIAHVCMTTNFTINSAKRGTDDFNIPNGFFFNAQALGMLVDDVQELQDQIEAVPMNHYLSARKMLGVMIIEEFSQTPEGKDKVAAEGEGEGRWKVVTPCWEDAEGIRQILIARLLPKSVLIALLMVDFWNPVFSPRRAQLLRYIPSTATLKEENPSNTDDDDPYGMGADLVEVVKGAIVKLELDKNTSPEAEFLELIQHPDLTVLVKQKIQQYVVNINSQLKTKEGVLGYLRLAETKRRQLRPPPRTQRPLHPLAEFDMSLPYATKMDAFDRSIWVMQHDATVKEIDPPQKIWHPRNNQAHFSAAGCPFSASF